MLPVLALSSFPPPPRWCPTILPRKLPYSNGGLNSHTHRNQRKYQNIIITVRPLSAPPLHRLTTTSKAPSSEHHPVFSKPLKDSLRRASVQISTSNANGDLYVWGYIPVVVAKWSVVVPSLPRLSHPTLAVSISRKTVRLRPHSHHHHSTLAATEVAGTFRVNGSAKRMRDLQAAFEAPPRVRSPLPGPHIPFTRSLVRKIPRLEERTVHNTRRRQRLSTISHTDARKFRPSNFSTPFPISTPTRNLSSPMTCTTT